LTFSHKKIILKDSLLGHDAFADYYRFGDGSSAPLIFYIGGATNEEKYRERMSSTPDAVVHEFERAHAEAGSPTVDLLITPSPVTGPERKDTILQDFYVYVLTELLPAMNGSKPNTIACMGFSFGAYLSTYLALNMPEVRGLGIFGGVALLDAVSQSSHADHTDKRFYVAANFDDPTYGYSEEFVKLLADKGLKHDFFRRTGGHAFVDYAENDTVKDLFRFMIISLMSA
jgi:pimeloyl-ACP methyl ester carboxylesterase